MKLATSVLSNSSCIIPSDSAILTVGIATVKSMIESSSLRSTTGSLLGTDMKATPAGVSSKHRRRFGGGCCTS
jgi:hypothetical protein